MSDATRYEVSKGIATITLDRAQNRNALSAELVQSLGDRIEHALSDDAVRVIVLTNEGPAFCAGADLKAGGLPVKSTHTFDGILSRMLDSPKPVVGRIAGHCMGGGVGLAAACDISVAAEDVRFGFTEVRLGLTPAIISVVVLPKMRRADALELFLSGERIPASRAQEAGLITRVAPRDALDDVVAGVVRDLAAGGPNALAGSKRLINDVPKMDRDEAFAWTATFSAEFFRSDEGAEGMAAFREKRPASWVPDE